MSAYPISFWVAIGMLIAASAVSYKHAKQGIGILMFAVIGTVAVWYVGDAIYNDYAHSYALIFDAGILQMAWLEVAWFLLVFVLVTPLIHQRINARYLGRQSGILHLVKTGVDAPALQRQLDALFKGCLMVYVVIVIVAAIRLKGQIPYFFFPFLGYKAEPWGRQRIGSGFDALLSFALYIQMMVTTFFGVLAAVATNRRTRMFSILLCFCSWPYFLFDRTRNTILAVVIPAVLSWVFLRMRGSIIKKAVVLGGCYILVNGWLGFIIENRSNVSITSAFKEKGFNLKKEGEVHHEGLNMFEELCWINTFIDKGTYNPNWGARYFAELVNPVPRALWHNKPLIGIDYAIARGMGTHSDDRRGSDEGGVVATVSTGLIGQGVVNFGRIFGPVAAALLMGWWAAIVTRLDLFIIKLGRLPLYACALILTFNLGRDITLITLYPFVFGMMALWWIERRRPQTEDEMPQGQVAQATQQRRPVRALFHPSVLRRRTMSRQVYRPKAPGPVVTRMRGGNPPPRSPRAR